SLSSISSMASDIPQIEGLLKALRLFSANQIDGAEDEATRILQKNPLDQAAWTLKLSCLADRFYVDELENNDIGLAEQVIDTQIIATAARPGTSFARPSTSSRAANPILRPTSSTGRPLTGVVRPMSSARPGTMEQAVRTSRTSKTARAVSSQTARFVRLGTASMASNADGPFVNLARLNVEKYAKDPEVNRQLFEYVFYLEGDIKIAHQIAAIATKEAEFGDWYWKNQLGKCYYRLGMLKDAEQQFNSSIKTFKHPETYAYLAKVHSRLDQPGQTIKDFQEGLERFPDDITLMLGLARTYERLNQMDESVSTYKQVAKTKANDIESIACIATDYFYDDQPEIALSYYRRIMQMGITTPELFMNVGLCCFYSQQYDIAIACIERAHQEMEKEIAADVWYNTGQIALSIGDIKMATRCFRLSLTCDADHAESLTNLGVIMMKQDKWEQARSLFYSAVAKAPHQFEPHFNLGLLCEKSGLYSEARNFIMKALELFPDHSPSQKLFEKIDILYKIL
ncbi:hypothetical protein PENTCL1PPCAC_2172, partial [Pristionchus entomophagus]